MTVDGLISEASLDWPRERQARLAASNVPRPAGAEQLRVIMTLNGELVERASTVTELEHPTRAVAWLANALAERDVFLDEGHIILSGARSAAIRVSGGDGLGASLEELGSVSLRVAP